MFGSKVRCENTGKLSTNILLVSRVNVNSAHEVLDAGHSIY